MRRHNEQAELMKRRNAETKSDRFYGRGRALLRRHLRIGAMLLLVVTALLYLAPRTFGQKTWPKQITIEATKLPKEPLQYRLSEKEPQAETELDFKGTGTDWSFVQFHQLPEQVTLK